MSTHFTIKHIVSYYTDLLLTSLKEPWTSMDGSGIFKWCGNFGQKQPKNEKISLKSRDICHFLYVAAIVYETVWVEYCLEDSLK